MALPQANPIPINTVVVNREGVESPVVIKRQAWYTNVLVRAARTWLQVFLALMAGATVIPAAIPETMQGFVLMPVAQQALVAAQLAALSASISILQNLAEILTKLDARSPEFRG